MSFSVTAEVSVGRSQVFRALESVGQPLPVYNSFKYAYILNHQQVKAICDRAADINHQLLAGYRVDFIDMNTMLVAQVLGAIASHYIFVESEKLDKALTPHERKEALRKVSRAFTVALY